MMHKNLLRAYEKSQETFRVELSVRRNETLFKFLHSIVFIKMFISQKFSI